MDGQIICTAVLICTNFVVYMSVRVLWHIWQTYSTGITKKELTKVEIQEQTASLSDFYKGEICIRNPILNEKLVGDDFINSCLETWETKVPCILNIWIEIELFAVNYGIIRKEIEHWNPVWKIRERRIFKQLPGNLRTPVLSRYSTLRLPRYFKS